MLNPNVEIPAPKLLELNKAAIKLPQYDHCRTSGVIVKDLDKPAPHLGDAIFDPQLAYIPLYRPRKAPRKRREEVKLFDFVDSSKAIEGSSSEEERPPSKE